MFPVLTILLHRLPSTSTLAALPPRLSKTIADHQNRAGANKGGGGVAGSSESAIDRRERLRKLAMETIDLAKDPYILRTHLGTLECRLCLTLHVNEGSYLAHTQGKKHQTNLARRAARDNHDAILAAPPPPATTVRKKVFVKIGRPGYKIVKIREPVTQRLGLLFTISLPEIKDGERPRRRFMSAFEQKREIPNRAIQYMVVSPDGPCRDARERSRLSGYFPSLAVE
jgi:splicing factor 3A subunit 2